MRIPYFSREEPKYIFIKFFFSVNYVFSHYFESTFKVKNPHDDSQRLLKNFKKQ